MLGLALLGLPAAARATAQIQFDAAASNAFPTLAVPVGVRATGMGDVYTAVGDDVYSLRWNPAGLARLQGYQVGLMDNEWSSTLGLRQDFFAVGQALDGGAAWGAALDYFNLGTLDQRDGSGALLGQSAASAMDLTVGWAQPLPRLKGWQAGVAVEAVQQSLYGEAQWGYGADLGVLWQAAPAWSVGLSLDHLGVSGAGGNIPALAQAGVSSLWLARTLVLAADADVPAAGTPLLKAGAELTYGELRFRAGWRQALGQPDAQTTGFTAGVGFRVGSMTLDYSYVPYGDLSTVQRIQATIDLPRGFFAPREAVLEGTTTSAMAYFNAAAAWEKQGETLKALVQYQRCLEAYPPAQRAAALPFYAAAGRKVDELQALLSKGGDHSQIQKLTRATLADADRDLKAERYNEAIARLAQARKLDPDSPELKAELLEAQTALEGHISAFREAARSAAKLGSLADAAENDVKILAIAPDDAEALAYLTANRKAIKALLQATDRKAIYFYVAGKLEEAIKAWTEGQALDYFGDVDFKRNIDKARKQLELRSE